MSDIKNISYVLIPFAVSDKTDFEKNITKIGIKDEKFKKIEKLENKKFLGCIEEIFKTVKCYSCKVKDDENCEEIIIYIFETKIGFIIPKYTFEMKDLDKQEKKVEDVLEAIRNDKYDLINELDTMGQIVFFPGSSEKNAVTYHIVASKIDNFKECIMTATNEEPCKLDKVKDKAKGTYHQCYFSDNNVCLLSNTNDIIEGTKTDEEEKFRDKYALPFLYITILLHHERRAYLISRQDIINKKENSKEIKRLKINIMNLLSLYSYKLVSEDDLFQFAYSEYRKVLDLSECEATLSDLVFRLDEELEKKKDQKFTWISMGIAIASLVSVVFDVLTYFLK